MQADASDILVHTAGRGMGANQVGVIHILLTL
jgi:hypothetical protein